MDEARGWLWIGALLAAGLSLLVRCEASRPAGAGRPPDPGAAARLADARDVPAFEAERIVERLYGDPVEYLRAAGVDVTLDGLFAYLRRGDFRVEGGLDAALDALERKAGSAYGPLLTELWPKEGPPDLRERILRRLGGIRDRVAAPWLAARIADAPARLLPLVASDLAGLDRPDPRAAAALAARAGALGRLDPVSPGYVASDAPVLLSSLAALGDDRVLDRFAAALADRPTPDLLAAAFEANGPGAAPAALRAALDRLAALALARPEPEYDDLRLLDLMGRERHPRFVALLDRLLADPYVPIRIGAARVAGAWRVDAAGKSLRRAEVAARAAGDDGEDLLPPLLWALARTGDAGAVPRLLAFLGRTRWYRGAEFAVDALLDLGVGAGEILRVLPDAPFSLSRLPAVLARARMPDLPALDARIASLPDGVLRRALVLARSLGAGPEVREYIGEVADGGGNLRLYLTFSRPAAVRAVLANGANDHDRERALLAVPILPLPPEEKVAIAAGALGSGGAGVRRTAAAVLGRLGGAAAAAALAARASAEADPSVRERIAAALAALDPRVAGPAVLLARPDFESLSAVPEAVLPSMLGVLARTPGARPLLDRMLLAHAGIPIHLAAARALAVGGDPPGVEALAAAAESEDGLARALGMEGLLATAPDRLRALIGKRPDPLLAGYGVLFAAGRRHPPRDVRE